ncbi:hypothetical protein [Archaeoglobus sp.]
MEEISKVAKALSSITRLRLINIVSKFNGLTAIEIYKIYKDTYNDFKYRESIYRELEKLVDAKILKKEYDKDSKRLIYKLNIKNIMINFDDDLKIETDMSSG